MALNWAPQQCQASRHSVALALGRARRSANRLERRPSDETRAHCLGEREACQQAGRPPNNGRRVKRCAQVRVCSPRARTKSDRSQGEEEEAEEADCGATAAGHANKLPRRPSPGGAAHRPALTGLCAQREDGQPLKGAGRANRQLKLRQLQLSRRGRKCNQLHLTSTLGRCRTAKPICVSFR